MRKTIALGTFAALAAGSAGAGALDSVPSMKGSDTLKDITTTIVANCTALPGYPTDNSSAPGVQPIVYDGTGSGNGENEMKKAVASQTQLIAPMSRALGTGICDSTADRTGAEGVVFALDGLSVVFGKVFASAYTDGIQYTTSAGATPATPGVTTNVWRTVLREVYTGMGASGSNIYNRNCNSASRKAIIDNWDNLFAGADPGNVCLDSNPDASATEKGLRHAFRRTEESGTTDVFLAQLSLPAVNFMQTGLSSNTGIIPSGASAVQQNIYRGLANSPFCNVSRPEDDYNPVSMLVNGVPSYIPPMYQVGTPTGAGAGNGFAPYDASLGANARFLSPFMPEMQDQDPVRRKCIGPKSKVSQTPGVPREEVCGADGTLGIVLAIDPPPSITTAQRYPTQACDDGIDFQDGPAPTRPTGDAVRCPNGDAPLDGKCPLPVRAEPSAPGGVAFDCLNHGLNVPAAFNDQDGTGADYPDAPLTDAAQNADGRAYNQILRAVDGTIRLVKRPNPMAIGTMDVPVTGAYYRIHSSRSGLVSPAHTRTCSTQDDATDQIGCLVQLNPCSLGYAGGGAVSNNQGPTDAEKTIAAPVNGVAVSNTSVQALIVGGTQYPIARKLYVNSLRGFDVLAGSDNTAAGKDAEFDLAACFSNLPFSTAAAFGTAVNVASPFGFVPMPAPTTGGNPRALCEDANLTTLCAAASNADACVGNPAGIPSSSCSNGYRDGVETGVDTGGNCP